MIIESVFSFSKTVYVTTNVSIRLSISPLGQTYVNLTFQEESFLCGNNESGFIACVSHLNRRVSQVSFQSLLV